MDVKIGIYPRKLLFFTIIGFLIVVSVYFYKFEIKRVDADKIFASPQDNINMSQSTGNYLLNLDLQNDGSIKIADKTIPEAIKIGANYDELRYIVLDQPTEYYQKAEIVVNLPKSINHLVKDPTIIAVHGATPWGAYLKDKAITYRAMDVSEGATVTIAAQFPKGYFDFPATRQFSGTLENLPGIVWIIGSVLFITIALAIIIWMFSRSKYGSVNAKVTGIRETIPGILSPGIVGVLCDGHVGPNTIIATLVDLAQRGYIEIYNRESDFVIYQKEITPNNLLHLRSYEKILLEKIFLPQQKIAGSLDVEARLSRHLFSRKIALFYLTIYSEAKSLGYFDELPAKVHLKYRLVGIAMFFIGFAGYLASAFFAPDPKFVLIFWIAQVALGVLIVNLAPSLTPFSKRGMQERKKWLEFKNFLSKDGAYKGKEDDFEVYLPYALALGAEALWGARFVEVRFTQPQWYDYPVKIEGIEYFAKSFMPIIEYLGNSINLSSEPLVK